MTSVNAPDNNCYKFYKITSNIGLLDDCIDATYILHLENNSRLDHIKAQLQLYTPSKIVYILYNKGFKNCKKDKVINTNTDIVDSNLHVFKHAQKENYNNILILEDDFIFNTDIKNKEISTHISTFINNLDEDFVYHLGCIPYVQIPVNRYHFKLLAAVAAHACIYSKSVRERILKVNQVDIIDWDVFLNMCNCTNRYTYWRPLCYQLFPETENRKNWKSIPIISFLLNKFKYLLNMDKTPEPGFTIFYILSKCMILIFILIIMNLF
jgi:hypothetical protein